MNIVKKITNTSKIQTLSVISPLVMTGVLTAFSPIANSADVVLKDFSNVSQFSLNKHAKTVRTQDGVVLRLTPARQRQSGSAFSRIKVSTAKFSTYFKFRITNPGNGGADGLVFVVQPISSNVGSLGGGMGYKSIPKSVGVEFDTHNNSRSWNDPNDNHVGININGGFNGPTAVVSPAFERGQIWHVWIDYDGGKMEIRDNTTGKRPAKALLARSLNISKIIGGAPNAFIGFTSATGAAFANHDILSWTYRDRFEPVGVKPDCKTNKIAKAYTRTGAGENLVAPFTSPATISTKSYSGLVEVVVSGTGYSYGTTVNDVFFGVETGKALDPQYYQLNLGWNGAPLKAYLGEPRNIANFIKFVDGMGLAALPAYNSKHSYHFVMEVPKNAGSLSFGVADGDFVDNGGQYNIEVYPVKSNLPASCSK